MPHGSRGWGRLALPCERWFQVFNSLPEYRNLFKLSESDSEHQTIKSIPQVRSGQDEFASSGQAGEHIGTPKSFRERHFRYSRQKLTMRAACISQSDKHALTLGAKLRYALLSISLLDFHFLATEQFVLQGCRGRPVPTDLSARCSTRPFRRILLQGGATPLPPNC